MATPLPINLPSAIPAPIRRGTWVAIMSLPDTGVVLSITAAGIEVALDRTQAIRIFPPAAVSSIEKEEVKEVRIGTGGSRFTQRFWTGLHEFKKGGKRSKEKGRKYELSYEKFAPDRGYYRREQIQFVVNGENQPRQERW